MGQPPVTTLPFLLSSVSDTFMASGVVERVRLSRDAGLPAAVASCLAGMSVDAPESVLVGAIAFDRARPMDLVRPVLVTRGRSWDEAWSLHGGAALPGITDEAQHGALVPGIWRVTPEPSRAEYEAAVASATASMADDVEQAVAEPLRKVVLSRSLLLNSTAPIDLPRLLARLRLDPSVTTFSTPLPSGADGNVRTLVGATPELLLSKSGHTVMSHPLAGSTPRRPSPSEDRAAAEALMRSDKDLREHAAVVESIADVLTPFCTSLDFAPLPALVSTATMWHLGTRITGRLRDDAVSSLELLDAVHPTPAVCGVPQPRAQSLITELEGFDRDYFTGAVGWCDARGDGRWMVTIRCAEVSGTRARLYAGAGIVIGSDPAGEGAETSAKFETMLRALSAQEVVSRVNRPVAISLGEPQHV